MNLKQARTLKGLTQIDLQKRTGIHYSRISLIEKGHFKPNLNEKARFEKALKIPIDWGENKRQEDRLMHTTLIKLENDDESENLIETVKWFLINRYGQEGGLERLRKMSGEELAEVYDALKTKYRVPAMPQMRWNPDGSPNFDHLNEED